MKKIIILILSATIIFPALAQDSKTKPLGIVKIPLPDKKYYAKIEKQFYDSIWLGKSIFEFNDFYYLDRYDEFESKKMKFYYVPEFSCKDNVKDIKQEQSEYDFFELITSRRLFLMKYKGNFIGKIMIDYTKSDIHKGQTIPAVAPYIENDSMINSAEGIYRAYEKRKGKVFNVLSSLVNFWYIDKHNVIYVYDTYDHKNHYKTAYEFINQNIVDIKFLTDKTRKEIIIR